MKLRSEKGKGVGRGKGASRGNKVGVIERAEVPDAMKKQPWRDEARNCTRIAEVLFCMVDEPVNG